MNVLYITHYNGMGGANRSLLQMILELRERHEVCPFVLINGKQRENSLSDRLEQYGVPYEFIHTICFKKANLTIRDHLAYIKNIIFFNISIYKKIRYIHFDIVHTNSSIIATGAFLSNLLKAKHVWHLREFGEEDFGMKPYFGKFYERFIYSQTDFVISISKAVRAKYNKVISSCKNIVIYNGIPQIEGKYCSIHNNRRTEFVCVGWVNEYKNQIEILRAADYLVNSCNVDNFHLTIVGPCHPNYQLVLQNYIKEHSLTDYVTMLGETNEVKSVCRSMDVGIVPSKAEAFGRVTVEYMMQNLAVIANDSGANPELVNHGTTGLLYKHGEYMELAKAMNELMDDRELLLYLAKNAKADAQERFLSTTNSDQVFGIYKMCLSQ